MITRLRKSKLRGSLKELAAFGKDCGDWIEIDSSHLIQKPGVGDLIERIAKPIAGIIDSAFGTKISKCSGCKKRKRWLNRLTKN